MTMVPRFLLEAIDKKLRELTGSTQIFGGKTYFGR